MRRGGFSLVEISIVLVVISVMISGVLPYITESQKTNAANDTASRLEAIELAMLTFRAANGFIPCPSNITAALNGGTFGAAVASGCATANFTDANNAAGGVPTRDLGLSDEYAFDGWGRRMTYHVTRTLTGAGYGAGTGALTVNDASGAARTTAAAYAVVSHGPNGHGAYLRAGTSRFSFGATDPREHENCECDASATATTYDSILVQSMAIPNSNPLAAFDDIVRYQLKPSLELLVGGGGGSTSCTGIAPSGWPDMIACSGSSGFRYSLIYDFTDEGNGRVYYRENTYGTEQMVFNADGSHQSSGGNIASSAACNGKSISTLESEGAAFNFCGGSGGAGWEDVPLGDTANYDTACMYRITQGGVVDYPEWMTATYIAWQGNNGTTGNYARIPSTEKGFYDMYNSSNALTSNNAGAVTKIEKNCGGGGGSAGAAAGAGFAAYHNATQARAHSTTVLFNTEIFDDLNGYDPATATFTAPTPGTYHFSAHLRTTPANTPMVVGIYASVGGEVCAQASATATTFARPSCSGTVKLGAGETVTVVAMHNNGGSSSVDVARFSGHAVGGGGGGGISATDFQTVSNSVTAIGNKTVSVTCPANYTMTGGGCNAVAWGSELVDNYPNGNGWYCASKDSYGTAQTTIVYARCVLTN